MVAEQETVALTGDMLVDAIGWWLAHMQRDVGQLTSVVMDGAGIVYFAWTNPNDETDVLPYALPLKDLFAWTINRTPTKARHFPASSI